MSVAVLDPEGIAMTGQPWTALAPLINFTKLSSGAFPVLPRVTIRGLTSDDLGRDDPHSLFRFLIGQTAAMVSHLPRSWALVGEFEQPRDVNVLQSQVIHEEFSRVVDALHLLHDEMVEFPFVILGEGRSPLYSMGAHGAPFPPLQAWSRASNQPYTLSAGEEDPLRELAISLNDHFKAEPDGAVAIGVGRINATRLRFTDADRIIDSAIALEAILLKGSEDELSYRQAVRGAHLLGGSSATRSENFRLLRRAYDRRSKIVHGVKDPGTPSTDAIVSIARKVVLAFVAATRNVSHETLIQKLDESAVVGPKA